VTDLNIMDSQFNGLPEMYRAEVFPELFPHAPRMRMDNWPAHERAMLIGGEEAKAFYRLENTLAELRAVPQRILMGASD
jgi:hypothetical protein